MPVFQSLVKMVGLMRLSQKLVYLMATERVKRNVTMTLSTTHLLLLCLNWNSYLELKSIFALDYWDVLLRTLCSRHQSIWNAGTLDDQYKPGKFLSLLIISILPGKFDYLSLSLDDLYKLEWAVSLTITVITSNPLKKGLFGILSLQFVYKLC